MGITQKELGLILDVSLASLLQLYIALDSHTCYPEWDS